MSKFLKRSAQGAQVPHEKRTSNQETVKMPLPSKIVLSMGQHIGAPAAPQVAKGDQVCVGTVVGKAGGFVSSDIHSGVSGTVEEITLNHTKLTTPDGLTALLPNKELAASKVTNYTVLGRRRIVWRMSAAYGAPTETVKAACHRAVEATEHILNDPAPAVYLTAFGESGVDFTVYCWAAAEDFWTTQFALA